MFRAMKKHLKVSALFLSTLTFYTHAIIIESPTLNVILDYTPKTKTKKKRKKEEDIAPKKILAIFDIDNTLAWSHLGDAWFSYTFKQELAAGKNERTIFNDFLPSYFYAQEHIDLKLVEEGTPQLLQQLNRAGVQTIALTARSLLISNRTTQQLNNLGIDFSKGSHRIKRIGKLDFGLAFPSKYKNGTIFCGNNDKGKLLIHFLDILEYYPDLIIFVDDKLKNVTSVKKAVENKGIEFVGIRLSTLDKEIKKFDPKKANKRFNKLLKEFPPVIRPYLTKPKKVGVKTKSGNKKKEKHETVA